MSLKCKRSFPWIRTWQAEVHGIQVLKSPQDKHCTNNLIFLNALPQEKISIKPDTSTQEHNMTMKSRLQTEIPRIGESTVDWNPSHKNYHLSNRTWIVIDGANLQIEIKYLKPKKGPTSKPIRDWRRSTKNSRNNGVLKSIKEFKWRIDRILWNLNWLGLGWI